MSKELQDALAQAAEDIKPIVGKLDSLVLFVNQGVPAIVSAAVAKALADANVEDKAAAKAIKEIVATIKANVDEIIIPAAEENAPPPVAEPVEPPADEPVVENVTVVTTSVTGVAGSPVSGHLQAAGGSEPYTFDVEGSVADLQVTPDGFYAMNPEGPVTGVINVVATDAEGRSSEPTSVTFSVS